MQNRNLAIDRALFDSIIQENLATQAPQWRAALERTGLPPESIERHLQKLKQDFRVSVAKKLETIYPAKVRAYMEAIEKQEKSVASKQADSSASAATVTLLQTSSRPSP